MQLFVRVAACLVVFASLSIAQQPAHTPQSETSMDVPAVTGFHPTVSKIWHDAWPAKNVEMLRQLRPDVRSGIAAIAAAELPGILRERKDAWGRAVVALKSAGEAYDGATDDATLLAAAERLHQQYEALVRVIRPALREMQDFHAVLYPLYHHWLPNGDVERVKSSVGELRQKMAALNSAELPLRLKGRQQQFSEARTLLAKSMDELHLTLASNDMAKIRPAVEQMHARYEALDKIVE